MDSQAPPPAPHPKYAWPEKPRLIGTRVSRIDGPLKVTGRAKYSYDILRPGMLYGRIVRSPHAHARLKSIDAAAAEKAPGVKALLITIKPGDKVLYPGEELGALAAATEQQAADALRMIKMEWEVLPALATVEQSMRPEAPQVFTPANTRRGTAQEDGNLDAGFAAAAHTVEGTYSTQVQTHTSLETHGCICEWNGENLTAWVSTTGLGSGAGSPPPRPQ